MKYPEKLKKIGALRRRYSHMNDTILLFLINSKVSQYFSPPRNSKKTHFNLMSVVRVSLNRDSITELRRGVYVWGKKTRTPGGFYNRGWRYIWGGPRSASSPCQPPCIQINEISSSGGDTPRAGMPPLAGRKQWIGNTAKRPEPSNCSPKFSS